MDSDQYQVDINGSTSLQLSKQQVEALDIIRISETDCHVLSNNQSHKAQIIESDFNKKTYKVTVNNNVYNIFIYRDIDLVVKKMGFELGSSKLVNDIKAPMPGLILDIPIKVGDKVNENDTLLVLEAMKMENAITSPRNGSIKNILVKNGDPVEKSQLLIEFE